MTSSRFNLGSTLKPLNLFFLQFNKRSGSENLVYYGQASILGRIGNLKYVVFLRTRKPWIELR